MASTARTTYTPEEYLALELEAEYKSEYINGQIYAMSGASYAHGLIAANLVREIGQQLKGKPCTVSTADLRVKVSVTGMYTYPDIVSVCGRPTFDEIQKDTLTNPTMIAEVLSPSTEKYDREEKFDHYRTLASLQEYVLVSQDRVRVDHFIKRGEEWTFMVLNKIDDTLNLTSIDCSVPLREIYDKVEFATTDGE